MTIELGCPIVVRSSAVLVFKGHYPQDVTVHSGVTWWGGPERRIQAHGPERRDKP